MMLWLVLLAGCELVADERIAPPLARTGTTVVTRVDALALDCRPTIPLLEIDLFDPDPSIWHGYAGGRYVRSEDQGASWTLQRSIHEGSSMGDDGTFGTEVVIDDDTWVAQRGNLEPYITRDGGQLFEPLEVFDDGGGLTVPTGPAEQWAAIDESNGLAWRQGLWFASSDGAQTWERVGSTRWDRFEKPIDFDGNRRLVWHLDEPNGENVYLVEADGAATRIAPAPQTGGPETWLSQFFTRFVDADTVFSVTGYLRVQSLADGSGTAAPIAGGDYQPSSLARLPDGRWLTVGEVVADTGGERRWAAFVVEPATLAVREVTLDVGGAVFQPGLHGSIDHDDGTATLLMVGEGGQGRRMSSLCRVGDGIEAGFETIVEGVPDDLAPGEVAIAALRHEGLPDEGQFALGAGGLPVWVYDGIPYQASAPAPQAPVDGGTLPTGFAPMRARFVFADGLGGATVFHDSPDGSITRTMVRGTDGEWEGIFTGELMMRAGTFGGHTDYVQSGTERGSTRGLGIDGVYTPDTLVSPSFTLGAPRYGLQLDGLAGRFPREIDDPWAMCTESPVPADCLVFGDRIVEDLVADGQGNVYLADRWHGAVWMHAAGAPGDAWERVADGFANLRDLQVRERGGQTVIYALDHVVYAFTPEPGTVARWSSP